MGVGAYLVRRVAVGGDAVRSDHHLLTTRAHEMPGHVVGYERNPDVVFKELPGRQAGPCR